MTCPRCGKSMKKGGVCPNCGYVDKAGKSAPPMKKGGKKPPAKGKKPPFGGRPY